MDGLSKQLAAVGLFFNSWSTAVEGAISPPNNTGNAQICGHSGTFGIIDPGNKTAVNSSAALSSLGFGFYSQHGTSIMSLVTRATEESPKLRDAFWSSGITDSMVKISNMEKALADIKRQFQTNLGNTLSLIQGVNQTDVSLFLALTNQGHFAAQESVRPRVDIDANSKSSFSSSPFKIYLITSALAQINWTALILPGVDVYGLLNDRRDCPSWAKANCTLTRYYSCNERPHFSRDECLDESWAYRRT